MRNPTIVNAPLIIFKVAPHILKEKPIPQRTSTKFLTISTETIKKMTKPDLKLIKTKNMVFAPNSKIGFSALDDVSFELKIWIITILMMDFKLVIFIIIPFSSN